MEPADLRAIVSKRIRDLSTERRLSLNKLADFSGLDRSAFYEALRGDSAMTTDRLCKIANALGVEPWELLRDPGQEAQTP